MPAVTREMSIVYAGFTVGGSSSSYLLNGKYRQQRAYDRSSIAFDVTVVDSTEAGFASACAALEAAYRTPRGALQVILGGSNLINLSHTGNTGYNAAPLAAKEGAGSDTGRSRKYNVTIEWSEPADLSGQSGRRESSVERTFDPSRKGTIAIAGTYTALGGNSAQAQYEASSAAFFSSVTSGFGGTWEKVSERTSRDDANKELAFNVVFEEIIHNQAVGVLDHAAIVQPRIMVLMSIPAPGDSPLGGARRLRTVTATIETSVDKTVTSDLAGLYSGTIRPHLINEAQAVAGGGLALVNEEKRLDLSNSRISATLTFLAVSNSTTFEYSLRTKVREHKGITNIPVWSDNAHGKRKMRGPALRTRTISERIVEFGAQGVLDIGPGPIDIFALPGAGKALIQSTAGGEGWIMMEGEVEEETRRLGEAESFDLTERTCVWMQEWVELPQGGTGGTST